jgi:dienelactone hydrolase
MLLLAIISASLSQLSLPADAQSLVINQSLSVDASGSWNRRAINTDAVVQLIVDGKLAQVGATVPKAGDRLRPEDEKSPLWEPMTAESNDPAMFMKPNGRYLLTTIRSERERVMVLEGAGHALAYMNGEPRVGDPYVTGYVRVPVLMREGENTLMLLAGRRRVTAKLRAPTGDVELNTADVTMPDITADGVYMMSVPVLNNTNATMQVRVGATALTPAEVAQWIDGVRPTKWASFSLPPLSITKVPVEFRAAYQDGAKVAVRVFVDRATEESGLAFATIELPCVKPESTHKRTFVSGIDGSVQYYAVVPAVKDALSEVPAEAPGFVLSLHGASVEAIDQARAYSVKSDFVIVCPTNRRPFGFDWEDWGRVDAIEVMNVAKRWYGTNPRRQYVTGHSMGGHGTWQLATLYPDLFAAAAPSAGWLSFDTYSQSGGISPRLASRMRAGLHPSSLTQTRMENLRETAVYMLHGGDDDNVPTREPYLAALQMSRLGIAYDMHIEPGVGHWWDKDGPGAACVDWDPIFAMFRENELPARGSGAAFARRGLRMAAPIDARSMPKGSFKRVFDRHFVMVYGTAGDDVADAWALAKARFDAETWWYRGNGYAMVMADTQATAAQLAGRNVVVYGMAADAFFEAFAGGNPRVSADVVRDAREAGRGGSASGASGAGGAKFMLFGASVGSADARGDELPHIGVITGDSPAAMRALDRVPIFSSGVMLPERFRFAADAWTRGEEAILERSDVK